MKSILEIVHRHFPKLPPETWAEIQSELGRKPLQFGWCSWPSPGNWPDALLYARFGKQDIPIDQLDTPEFAAETARIQQWCAEVLAMRIQDETRKIEHEQRNYRAVLEEEGHAVLLAGLARTSRNELLVWLPLAVRMMSLYNAISVSPDVLAPYLVTLPEGSYLAYADIVIHDRLCLLAEIPREFQDMTSSRYYVRGKPAEHYPVSVTGVAYWLDEVMPVNDYIGILQAMKRINEILLSSEETNNGGAE